MNVIPIAERRLYKEDRGVTSVLEIYELETGVRRVVKEYAELIEAPNWTKDGKRLIFNRCGRIVSYDLDTGAEKELESGAADACNNDHVLSPDGAGIAVSHNTWEDGLSRIYTLPLTGGVPTLVTPIGPSYLHGWSPDGRLLAYCAERNGRFNIYTIPVEGGVETQLTGREPGAGREEKQSPPVLDDGPEYSPREEKGAGCGPCIWFNSTRSGLMQVWRMDSDGANPRQMTFDECNNWFPHISPDGSKVVYITYNKDDAAPHSHPPNKHVELRLMAAEGGPHTTLVKLFGGQGTINVNSWAPDSKRFAFVSYILK
ncbi:MAG: hypothetical protein LBS62_04535 [Clostridiales bacterium]|jgi:Tol biopolymer transport system component|nr:hypothetical protein [Clostridiales bacterium]